MDAPAGQEASLLEPTRMPLAAHARPRQSGRRRRGGMIIHCLNIGNCKWRGTGYIAQGRGLSEHMNGEHTKRAKKGIDIANDNSEEVALTEGKGGVSIYVRKT